MIDLLYNIALLGMVAAAVLRFMQQRRIMADTNEAAEDLLDAMFSHWIMYNQLEHRTATHMRAELRNHFIDVLANGGSIDDVVGPDVAAFADDWASAHGGPGPQADWGWRFLSLAGLLFAAAMSHRTVDLFRDGLADLGFAVGALLAAVFALPIAIALPWLSRLSASGRSPAQLQRFAVFVLAATTFVFFTGWALKEGLTRNGYSFDPQPGRWWVSALVIPCALAVGLVSDELPRRRRSKGQR